MKKRSSLKSRWMKLERTPSTSHTSTRSGVCRKSVTMSSNATLISISTRERPEMKSYRPLRNQKNRSSIFWDPTMCTSWMPIQRYASSWSKPTRIEIRPTSKKRQRIGTPSLKTCLTSIDLTSLRARTPTNST